MKLLASPFQVFETKQASYAADSFGQITATDSGDIAALIAMGCAPVPGTLPASLKMQFGGAAIGAGFDSFALDGNLHRIIGNPVAANAADTTDDILDGFVLPANAFDQARRGMLLRFAGKFAANGNNKRVKVFFNPTMSGQTVTNGVIAGGTVTAGTAAFDSGVLTDNAAGFWIEGALFKYGAAGSNTQAAFFQSIHGATHAGIALPTFPTLNEAAAINCVITGSSPTTGAASDVALNFAAFQAFN